MSTPSERLEAEVWLEANHSGASPETVARFFAGVDEYYTQFPTADRGPHILAILKEDNEAFARIVRDALGADAHPAAADA